MTAVANVNDDDAPIGPDDVAAARVTLRRFRLARGVLLVAGVAAALSLGVERAVAAAATRELELRDLELRAMVEKWNLSLTTTAIDVLGTRVHRGEGATVVEARDFVALIVDDKVVALAPRTAP